MLTKNDAHIIILERHNEWLLMIQKTILFKSSVFYTCLNVNDLMAIFCSERRDSGTKRTMKKTSRRATRVAKITTDSSLPGHDDDGDDNDDDDLWWWGPGGNNDYEIFHLFCRVHVVQSLVVAIQAFDAKVQIVLLCFVEKEALKDSCKQLTRVWLTLHYSRHADVVPSLGIWTGLTSGILKQKASWVSPMLHICQFFSTDKVFALVFLHKNVGIFYLKVRFFPTKIYTF